jgi:hypothetical protein
MAQPTVRPLCVDKFEVKRKRVAVSQSNYIPWKGYIDLLAFVDEFVLYDDVQFTKRDWRNRNLIKTPRGLQWLTVPARVKGRYLQTIRETEIDGTEWSARHWRTLAVNYGHSPFFGEIAAILEPAYSARYRTISELNRAMLEIVCRYLDIETKISDSADFDLIEGRTERLADICRQAGATEYVSGPSAKAYVDEGVFQHAGIDLTWFDYSGYPEYPQLWGPFEHGVSIVDLLFNCGKDSASRMKYVVT